MKVGFLNVSRFKKIGEKIVEKAQKVSLPFFDGVPIYNVALFFWRSIVDGAITTRASAIAFSFFVAFFPFVIFLFTLIPYIPIENFQNELLLLIKEVVPGSTFTTIEETLTTILKQPRGDLLSFGFFAALIFSTNGLASMMSAFDATVHSIYRRKWFSQRIAAIVLLFILSVLLTIAIALLTGGQWLINYLQDSSILRDSFTVYLLTFGKWVITIFLFFFAYSFLYYMAPARKTKWRFISAGGTLATVLSIITIASFTYYINNFSRYNILYGSIGTLLIILLLMYVMSLILLVGFELNASIYQAHTEKEEENII
ncbi:YihY/virulence factor BrkB family protein [Maribellus comscasis]|uniref:YihY/virulence factor BrkB family protein n=1 Tax=Maribellus comscasis TaxID=2681766 RepID=UPI00131ABF6D|nr:YihY/virulence factor BrkB family protein [Maribellus comscasis]